MSVVVECELPDKWEIVKIGDFAHTTSGGTPKRSNSEYYGGNVPWVKSGDLNDASLFSVDEYISDLGLEKSSAKLFKPGTVLIALYGATIGRLSILQIEAASNQAVCGITLPDEVDNKYLFYYLRSIREKLIGQGKGGAQPNISQGVVKEIEVSLAPPEQQKRIVAKIEELFSHIDAGIAALTKAKQLLKQYRQSVLKAAVTGELTKQWREENKDKLEPASQLLKRILQERRQKWEAQQLEQFKAKEKVPKDDKWKGKYKLEESNPHMVFETPKEWAVSTIESITDPVRVICYGILMPKQNVENGVLYVKVKDVKFGRVLLKQLNRTAPEIAEKYARASLIEGDLLLTIRGTYGRTAMAPKELNGGNITQDTVRISAIEPILNEYLIIFIDSIIAQQYFKAVARGVAVKGVNVQDVRNMKVPIPSVEEQKKIIELVDQKVTTITHVEKELENQLVKAKKNKQSILASAFSGRLS